MKTKKNHKRPNEQTNQRRNHDPIRSRKTIQSRQNKNTSRIRTKTTRPTTRNPNMERTRNQRHIPALERNYVLKDMTEEEVAYWDDVIKRMVESDSWKGILRERGWESFYKGVGRLGVLDESSGWYGGWLVELELISNFSHLYS